MKVELNLSEEQVVALKREVGQLTSKNAGKPNNTMMHKPRPNHQAHANVALRTLMAALNKAEEDELAT